MKVFISYSSKDEVEAKNIAERLNGWKIDYWLSCEHLNEDHMIAIPREISSSDVVLLLVSEHSKNAPGQETEVKFAEEARKDIIPYLLENIDPVGTWLSWPLKGYQNIKGYEDRGFEKLMDRLLRKEMSPKSGHSLKTEATCPVLETAPLRESAPQDKIRGLMKRCDFLSEPVREEVEEFCDNIVERLDDASKAIGKGREAIEKLGIKDECRNLIIDIEEDVDEFKRRVSELIEGGSDLGEMAYELGEQLGRLFD